MSAGTAMREYDSLTWAQQRLAIGRPAMLSLIERGLVTVRRIPGSRPVVLVADVERLVERHTRWAGA